MSRLQSVQNAAARLIIGVRQCKHITPALRQLHWLPVRRRVDFKISTLVYCSLAGTAPVYLADECTLVTAAGCSPLRSADNRTCLVKRSYNQFGDRCFATAGPTLWNSLPEQLRQPDITFGQFKRSCTWTLTALTRNLLTYLHNSLLQSISPSVCLPATTYHKNPTYMYRQQPMDGEVSLIEEIAEMSVAWEKQIRADHHSDLHVDWQDLTGSCQMVDENYKLHPAFPFIRLISTEYGWLVANTRRGRKTNFIRVSKQDAT